MASINSYLAKILEAKFGEEVRKSIHDAIEAINIESTSTFNKVDNISVTAIKLPRGQDPTVTITDNGNQKNIRFGIPAGDPGIAGPPGPQGPKGDPVDVRIGGTSIIFNHIADIPLATNTQVGVVSSFPENGTRLVDGKMVLVPAGDEAIAERSSSPKPIVPGSIDYAVKAAMCDGKGASWSDLEKKEARKRIGIDKTIQEFENTGIVMIDGKLCVKVERS